MKELEKETIQQINELLVTILDGNEEGDFTIYFRQALIQHLKEKNINPDTTNQILHSQLIDNPYEVQQIYTYNKKLTKHKIHTLHTLNLHKALTTPEQWQNIETKLNQYINQGTQERQTYDAYQTDTDKYIIYHHGDKIIYEETNTLNKNKENQRSIIIGAIPTNIKIHQNPFLEEVNQCDIDWKTKIRNTPLQMRDTSRGEIKEYLKKHGLIFNQRRITDILNQLLYHLQINGKVEIDTDINTPGIYWSPENKKIITKHLQINNNTTYEEELEALDLLDEYVQYFQGNEDKLATILKWGWISPFSFLTKQLELDWIPGIYLYGKAGSGKTEGYGYPVLYMYSTPEEKINNIGGSSVDTVARLGHYVSSTTLPLLINEPGVLFTKKSLLDMFKNCISDKIARGRFIEYTNYQSIPAYSNMLITSNTSLPSDEAIRRRLYILNCSRNESTEQTKKEFTEKFKPKQTQTSPLNKLKIISAYVVKRITKEPDILYDWQNAIDTILYDYYIQHGREIPQWLTQWKERESHESMDKEKRTIIQEDLQQTIIQSYKHETKQPINNTPYSIILDVAIESGDIPWIKFKSKKQKLEKHEIAFSTGFKRHINKYLEEEETLKDISELLGWNYQKRVKCFDASTGIYCTRDQLLHFLFPAEEEYYYKERYTSNKGYLEINPFLE